MASESGHWWNRYLPSFGSNPFKLIWRLLTVDNPAARSAMFMAGAGLALTPVDMLMASSERRIYADAKPNDYPLLFVCGPPRSGTTLVAQYLINQLDVCYINNLTSLFPRSPIRANQRFGRWAGLQTGGYRAYYGRSQSLSGTNDGLHIWDRWLGADRSQAPEALVGDAEQQLPAFFSAFCEHYQQPLVNKVNRLNTCADQVAELLPNARIICLDRHPVYLAQSLYVAREEIMGDLSLPYGTCHPDRNLDDPVDDVCRQVEYFQSLAKAQQAAIGAERFSIVSYDQFCENPAALLETVVASDDRFVARENDEAAPESFRVSSRCKIDPQIFERFQARFPDAPA